MSPEYTRSGPPSETVPRKAKSPAVDLALTSVARRVVGPPSFMVIVGATFIGFIDGTKRRISGSESGASETLIASVGVFLYCATAPSAQSAVSPVRRLKFLTLIDSSFIVTLPDI